MYCELPFTYKYVSRSSTEIPMYGNVSLLPVVERSFYESWIPPHKKDSTLPTKIVLYYVRTSVEGRPVGKKTVLRFFVSFHMIVLCFFVSIQKTTKRCNNIYVVVSNKKPKNKNCDGRSFYLICNQGEKTKNHNNSFMV